MLPGGRANVYATKGAQFGVGYSTKWDWSGMHRGMQVMEQTATKVMSEAIAGVMKKEIGHIKRGIKQSMGPLSSITQIVADSLVIEEGFDTDGPIVRFGADPIDDDGPTLTRGGKPAQYLEYGVTTFPYRFEGKTIEHSKSWVNSTPIGYINARSTPMHPGFKAAFGGRGWLTEAYDRIIPQIPDALIEALDKAWGGGGP